PAECSQRLVPQRLFILKLTKPRQQAVAQSGMLRRQLDRRWLQQFQRAEGVTHTGGVEIDAQIAAEQAAFRHQEMPGEPRVKLSNQSHSRSHAFQIGLAWV